MESLGVKAKGHPIIIPRGRHHCIALFLGSCEKYLEEHRKEPGTYYLTKGWIEEGKSPRGFIMSTVRDSGGDGGVGNAGRIEKLYEDRPDR